jgi:hypothetical protein
MSEQLRVIPTDFDWVKARAQCTPFQVFERLRLQVKDDVDKRNAFINPAERNAYSFVFSTQGKRFSVAVESFDVDRGVDFGPTAVGIDVHDSQNNALLVHGVLTLSNDGECRLKVNEVEHNLWQFRKLALEDVLFTSVGKLR